jgi:cobaltochelatase CobN
VRPLWDDRSTRVTGFEVLPIARLDQPRVDVTCRVSGAFRDTFPDQLALVDRAVRAVARLAEEDEWNPLASARRRGEPLARLFGPAPGRYGAGTAELALDGDWSERAELGAAYLAATSHAYAGGEAAATDPSFAERVAAAEAFLHTLDVAERDLLDGDSVADSLGGFAAAAAPGASLYLLDTSRPEQPKARTAREEVSRLVHGRLTHPRWIEAQLRHGWRGAAELAQAVDALFVMAAAADAVGDAALDAVHRAYVGDDGLFGRLRAANPDAAEAIRARLAEAQARGLWRSRRNSPALLAEAAE